MYQAGLHDNPQMDVQGAQRIIRTGQTEQHAYLYRVMIDCFAEKTKLQRQVLKAGGWRQLKFNGDDACKLLDIPSSWEKDEPKEVDPIVVPLEEEPTRPGTPVQLPGEGLCGPEAATTMPAAW
jgi:hypothetical protein